MNKKRFRQTVQAVRKLDPKPDLIVITGDIADELNKQGYKVVKSQVRLPNGPIKTVGDNTVSVALHTDVVVDVTVSVYGETA